MRRSVTLVLVLLLALPGCAHRPGAGSVADAATTYAALSSGGHELNPLLSWAGDPVTTAGASLVLKQGVKYAIDDADMAHRVVESGGVFGAGWNLASLAGATGITPAVPALVMVAIYWQVTAEG